MKQLIALLYEIKSLLALNKEILTLSEFAIYAGISKNTAYKYTYERRLHCYRQGKHLYIKKEDAINFLLSNPLKSTAEIDQSAAKCIIKQSQ